MMSHRALRVGKTAKLPKSVLGVSLIEVMVGIFIFSIGILSLVGVQATSLRAVSDARYRSAAALLANDLMTEARLSNRATIKKDFDSSSPDPIRFRAWKARIEKDNLLPAVASNPPLVEVGAANQMTITLRWQAPSDKTVRQHIVTTQFTGETK